MPDRKAADRTQTSNLGPFTKLVEGWQQNCWQISSAWGS